MLALTGGLAAPAAQERPAGQKKVNGFIGGAPGTAAGRFLEPTDVTVLHGRANSRFGEGKIFVVEGLARNSRVQRLDDDGNFELAWGEDVVRSGAAGDTGTGYEVCTRAPACKAGATGDKPGELDVPSGVAVNQSTGAVYVLDGGNARVQQFTVDGRFVREWSLDFWGTRGRFERAPIAVAPAAPHDVFVGDDGANRVLQYDARGDFIQGWGWGVNTRLPRLEVCTLEIDCETGRRPPGVAQRKRTWPRHLAVDADGVVYSSPFLGIKFESNQVRAKIYRFRSDFVADSLGTASAARQLLDPLDTDGSAWGEDGTPYLTDGATLGLDIDPASGRLLVINNPFGTSQMDEVRNPGADGRGRRPVVDVVDELPFLQNVTGIAAGDGLTLLSSGRVKQPTGTSGYTGCPRDDARRDCHGLIAIAAGGPPQARLAPLPGTSSLGALVDPGGVATYRFEASRDGRAWRRLGPTRYVAGNELEPLPAPVDQLAEGVAYKLRLVVTKRTEDGDETAISGETLVIGGGYDGAVRTVRTADPARKFAPLVSLHSRERRFPIGAHHFLDWATLKWDQEGCPPTTFAVGLPRHRSGLDDPGLAVLEPERLGRGVPVYRFRSRRTDCPTGPSRRFAATDHTRPTDPGRPGGLRGPSGFYLDLATDELDGQGKVVTAGDRTVLGDIPVYVERLPARIDGRPALRLVYWFLYGSTNPPEDEDYVRSHEGGWERVSVLVRRAGPNRYLPESVRYHAWGERTDIGWMGLTRVGSSGRPVADGTHPLVLSALGSHASYSEPGSYDRTVRAGGREIAFVDHALACADCPQWRTWEHLLPLRRQPWYGFGGGWGRVFEGTHTTGPLGPSPFRRSDQ